MTGPADDQTPPPPIERPAECIAKPILDYGEKRSAARFMSCERCGLAWEIGVGTPPQCKTLTRTRLVEIVEREANYLEGSFSALVQYRDGGMKQANPLVSLARSAELRGVARFLNRVLNNDQILDILIPGRKRGG